MLKLVCKFKDGSYFDNGYTTTDSLEEAEDFSDYEYPNLMVATRGDGKLVWAEASEWKETHDWTE